MRNLFRWTFYFGVFLALILYSQAFLSHDGLGGYTKFSLSIYDTRIIDFTKERIWKWHEEQQRHEAMGMRVRLLVADTEILHKTWSYDETVRTVAH